MTDREKQKALSLYRLTQAEESLDEARYLFRGEKPAIRHQPGLLRHVLLDPGAVDI
jgi:hypothetical protein